MSVLWFEASSHHKKSTKKFNKVWSWREKTEKDEGSCIQGNNFQNYVLLEIHPVHNECSLQAHIAQVQVHFNM